MVSNGFNPSTWEVEANLVYKASFRTARATQRNPVLKNKQKKKSKKILMALMDSVKEERCILIYHFNLGA